MSTRTKEIRLYVGISEDERQAAVADLKARLLAGREPEPSDEWKWQYTDEGRRLYRAKLKCRLCGAFLSDHAFARTGHGKKHEVAGEAYSYAPTGYTTEYFVKPEALLSPEEREKHVAREARKAELNAVMKAAWEAVGNNAEAIRLEVEKMQELKAAIDGDTSEEELLEGIREYRKMRDDRLSHGDRLRAARNAALKAAGSSWDEWYLLNHGEESYRTAFNQGGRDPNEELIARWR